MMHLRVDFFSEALQLSTSMTVLLPQDTQTQIGMAETVRPGGTPVLYLLHGLSDDDTTWLRRTSIERYVAELGIAVVMPAGHRSFYSDMQHEGKYWQFLAEELPSIVASTFRVSTKREDTFVAGLSMGGYGAFKLALRHPDRFAAAGSLSGALDMSSPRRHADFPELFEAVWGGPTPPVDDDPVALLDTADPATLPRLWLSCGTEDIVVADSRVFVERAGQRNIPLHSEFHPGEHEWGYWDTHIQRFLSWLGEEGLLGRPLRERRA